VTPSLKRRLIDPAIIVAITAFTALVSQRWTGLDTPDSSFYASLGLFGDQVSDRAPDNSYYWTRLGDIVPVRLLTSVLGTWGGFAAYRVLLLAIIVGGTYLMMRRYTCRTSAAFLALSTSLSTVVLSYVGNPYLTGTVMAGTVVIVACAMSDRRAAAAGAGVAMGWLVMTHPVGVLLAGTVWLSLRLQARTKVVNLLVAAGAAALTWLAFLGIGRIVFPQLNWIGTYLDANARMEYSNFASRDMVWLRDVSLIVPAMVLAITVVVWATHRREIPAQRALVLSLTSIGFMLVFNPVMGGIPLEAPMYQAMLWPPTLLALGLVTTLALPADGWTRLQGVTALLSVLLIVVTGHLTPGLPLWGGWLLALGVTSVFLFASYKGAIGAIASLALLLGGAQLLQNSRGDLGLYYLSPYANAFNDNTISDKIHTAVNAQEWLLANTTDDDQILNWVGGDWVHGDRELYVVAAMQLWGENRVTLDPVMSEADIARLATIRPSVIQMVAPTMDGVRQFWSSIPATLRPSAPTCYDFVWPTPGIPLGHSCLTRLDWSNA
jgi:hypothetical protein